jgi:hypothetical protein
MFASDSFIDLTTYLTHVVHFFHISELLELVEFSTLSMFRIFFTVDFQASVMLISRFLRLPPFDVRGKENYRTLGYILSHSIYIVIDRPLDWDRAENFLLECQKLTDLE